MKRDIKSMDLPELEEYFTQIGDRPFRAGQVFKWLHSGVKTFSEMTNLSEKLRAKLDDEFFITVPELIEKQVSSLDGTIKYLWRTTDSNAVESVVMEYAHGNTVCISTQVGCRMGCAFCASTLGGLVRNLAPSEMLDQVLYSQWDAGCKISNVVLMGIGEPLDNFDNVIRFLQILNHPEGINIGARHITLSTCGLLDNIDKLGDYGIQLTLSVSLHAPDDETRSCLMPANRDAGVDKLIAACERYFEKTGRRVSFEYAMIDGVNDSAEQAILLAEKIRKTGGHLNLILLNSVSERDFKPSGNIEAFTKILKQKGVNYTIRRSLGGDIDAACGQLRKKAIDNKEQ
ncbi:MAG: 23S rRNA (adenine(2503)-C(2))-methyltransferase RlmN [Oscillospiraceae bacterium]|nr:23S rRNA (adenine(2503)-C(2))-methyltransferase RlmN [Oscillospiraceae bacterium]